MYGSSSPGLGFRVRVRSSVKYYLEQEICQVQGKIGMVNRDFAHICHFSSKESVLAIKCNKMNIKRSELATKSTRNALNLY